MKIIVEVQGTWSGNCVVINELKFFSNSGNISYSTTAYDSYNSRTGGVEHYWNDTLWDRTKLSDGSYTYNSSNACIFLFNKSDPESMPSPSSWSRFLVELSATSLNKIEVTLGGADSNLGRTPKTIRFYKLVDDSLYNKNLHLNNRSNQNLVHIGELNTNGHLSTSTTFILVLIRSMVKFNDAILTFQNNDWVDTNLQEPLSEEDFEAYNISLSSIPKEKWYELYPEFEILTYTADDIIPKIELTIPSTKPYRLLDNPSIVTYTEQDELPILSQTVLAKTKVRFLVSKDKKTYQAYKNNEWVTVNKDDILEEGMTNIELETIPQEVWAEWFENEAHKYSFNILMGIYSDNPNPIIRSITVNYAENESPIIINAYIEPDTIHNEFALLKARVKDYEDDNISFKVLIKKAGTDEFVQVSPLEGWYNRSTSETEITQAFNFPYFNPGENEIKLVVKDERGAEAEWTGKVILSNTDPVITLAYDDFSMRATIGDDDNDMVAYRIAINGELIFDYTDFTPTKTYVNYVFDTSKLKFGEENTITIEVKDTHGGYAKQEFTIIGSYRGLMFKNENGEYFVDSNGEILIDLLFDGILIGGQTSETKKVILENRHEFPITNVQITPENPNFVTGAVVEISETEMPFTPKDIIKVLEVMPSLGKKDFYVRVKTTREAHQGGYFYINSKATPVIE